MGARANAISELTRFWLQSRHSCLVDESIPVPVPYALSDIDIIAMKADLKPFQLPDGTSVGPRLIIETKDEHDWEPTGREYGTLLETDAALMMGGPFIPSGTKGVKKYTMLRQEHFNKAQTYFGSNDFDRLFVLHALDPIIRQRICPQLRATGRIHFVLIREVLDDLLRWYQAHPRKAGLRHTLIGDVWHLLVGFCGFHPRQSPGAP